MSHLNAKLNTTSPDVTGAFTAPTIQSLSDYSTTTPTEGQYLIYDGANWEAGDAPPIKYPMAVFGRGEADDYSNAGISIATGNVLCLYDTAPINNMPSAVSFNLVSGTSWLSSVTLQAGKYEFITSAVCAFTSTGYLKYRWQDSLGTTQSSQAIIGEAPTNAEGKSSVLYGHIDTSSELEIFLIIEDAVNIAASQGNYISQNSTFSIRKVA